MKIFIITAVAVFVAIFLETLMFLLQLKGKKMTRLFGRKDFAVHSAVTSLLWAVMTVSFVILQFEKHPSFHDLRVLSILGAVAMGGGLFVSVWGFALMGVKRSLGINFYRDNIPLEKRGIYKYLRNPETAGLCWAAAGFAFLSGSLYNLLIALELIALMIPHTAVENLPLRDRL